MKELNAEKELFEMEERLEALEAKRDKLDAQIVELKHDLPAVVTFIAVPREADCGWTEWWDVYNRTVFTTAYGCEGRVGGFRKFNASDWESVIATRPEILTGKEYACKAAYYPYEDGNAVQFTYSDEAEDLWRVKFTNDYPLTDDEADYIPEIG